MLLAQTVGFQTYQPFDGLISSNRSAIEQKGCSLLVYNTQEVTKQHCMMTDSDTLTIKKRFYIYIF